MAAAVAASSAFPPVLSPLQLEPEKYGCTFAPAPPYPAKIVLTDGGVYDNLALETAWKECGAILVRAAGGRVHLAASNTTCANVSPGPSNCDGRARAGRSSVGASRPSGISCAASSAHTSKATAATCGAGSVGWTERATTAATRGEGSVGRAGRAAAASSRASIGRSRRFNGAVRQRPQVARV